MISYYFLIITCLCNYVFTAAIPGEKDSKILSYHYMNYGNGKYEFSYATSNGISRFETGELVNTGQDNEHILVKGFYSYVDPNGVTRSFDYTADENGYKVKADEQVKPDIMFPEGIFAGAVSPQLASLLG